MGATRCKPPKFAYRTGAVCGILLPSAPGRWEAGLFLKLVSLIGLLLAALDYFDLTHRLEAAARRISVGLWSAYGRYWHYIYHSTETDRTGFGKFLADLGGGLWKLVMIAVLFGTFVLGREAMQDSPLYRLIAMVLMPTVLLLLLSPLLLMALAWALHLLAMPRKGIVATVGLLLAVASSTIDFMR
jgi:hypothetical protein